VSITPVSAADAFGFTFCLQRGNGRLTGSGNAGPVYVGVNHLADELHAAPPAPDPVSSLLPVAAAALALLLVALVVAAVLVARR